MRLAPTVAAPDAESDVESVLNGMECAMGMSRLATELVSRLEGEEVPARGGVGSIWEWDWPLSSSTTPVNGQVAFLMATDTLVARLVARPDANWLASWKNSTCSPRNWRVRRKPLRQEPVGWKSSKLD